MEAEGFWHSTPAELGRYLEGAALARRDLLDMLTITAWQTVAFDRSKRLPELQHLLSRRQERAERLEAEAAEAPPTETREQMVEKWRAFFNRSRKAS